MSNAATSRHPVVELLARYGAVIGAAWAARHELAGPKRLADEAAFLPAALSLQETPVHPAPRRAMAAIVMLFVVALGWSIVGQVDIVAVAPGRIEVSEHTKVIQPLEAGVVRSIHVHDGDKVLPGQLLVELDATGASADRTSVHEQLQMARSEVARSVALLDALKGDAWASRADRLTRAEWGDITAKLAKLDAESTHRLAELATHRELLAKLDTTVPLARQREDDFKALADQGYVAGHAGQDRTRERIELERDLATQRARVKEAEAALAESRNARAAYLAETRRTLNERLTQASLKQAQFTQEGAKTEHKERLTRLTAPVAGTVQQLAIHTTGGVVTPAQPLMVIVPDGAEVTADVVIDNKDIGFVREGQAAQIKLETFSFTRYGTVGATVVSVSADAVNDEKRGAIFPTTLKLATSQIDVDGKAIRLGPGMNVTAEITTGKRRVIEYLLNPVQRSLSESFRER
jgi:hemolysin D